MVWDLWFMGWPREGGFFGWVGIGVVSTIFLSLRAFSGSPTYGKY